MKALSRLTKSQESYLHTIYILSAGENDVRLTDISEYFGVAKASVFAAERLFYGNEVRIFSARDLQDTRSQRRIFRRNALFEAE